MAEQNEGQKVGGSAGDNPNAGSWVDPEEARNPMAEALPTEIEHDNGQQLYIDERLQALREEGLLDEPPSEEDAEEAAEKEPAARKEKEAASKEAKDDKQEEVEPAIIRLMEREARLRESRKEFEAERKEYLEYKKQVELAQRDPIALLKAHGYSSEDQWLEFAKAAYYETDPDARPQDYTVNKQIQALQQELEALKSGKQEETQKQQQERLINEYRSKLVEAYSGIDKSQYPVMSRIEEAYGTEAVHYDLLQAAGIYAQENDNTPPTEEQAIAKLNELYEAKFGKLLNTQKASEPAQEAAPPKKKTTTLRNSQTKAYREPEGLEAYRDSYGDPEDYQKVSKLSRAGFQQWLKQQAFDKP